MIIHNTHCDTARAGKEMQESGRSQGGGGAGPWWLLAALRKVALRLIF